MSATIKLKLRPLTVPNFVGLEPRSDSADETGSYTIPVKELDNDALEELAYGFLVDFYKRAGKPCPFYRPANARAA